MSTFRYSYGIVYIYNDNVPRRLLVVKMGFFRIKLKQFVLQMLQYMPANAASPT